MTRRTRLAGAVLIALAGAVALAGPGAAQSVPPTRGRGPGNPTPPVIIPNSLEITSSCAYAAGRWLFDVKGDMATAAQNPPAVDIFFDDNQPNVQIVQLDDQGGSFSQELDVAASPPPPNTTHFVRAVQDSAAFGDAPQPNTKVETGPVSVTCPYPSSTPAPPTTRTTVTTLTTPNAPPTLTPTTPQSNATLTVDPPVGPPGMTTLATGGGFPPGPVTLVWQPGLGTTTATAGPSGTFQVWVLILPNDILGSRVLIATSGATGARAGFLVVSGSDQPPDFVVRR
jgi:hypothetical protein